MPETTTKPAPAPAAPAAPAAKPGPKPAPPPASPGPKPATAPPSRSIDDDLEAAFTDKAQEKPTVSPAKKSEADQPTETHVPASDTSKTDQQPDDDYPQTEEPKKDTPATPSPAPDPTPVKAPELRAAYAKSKAKVAELEKQLAEVKAKPVDDTERKTFTDQIVQLNKQLEDANGRLKFAAYEQSDEYKQKYEQPFVEAWQEGVSQITQLTITDEAGQTRKGTADDFQAIMAEPNNERAAQMATDMFGNNAFYALSQRRELQKLNSARNKALTEYRSTLSERTKSEKEAQEKLEKEREETNVRTSAIFKKLNDEAAQKYPQWFMPEEGDDEGNKLLEKGFRDSDIVFNGGEHSLTKEQMVKLYSVTRNKAAAFGRLVHKMKQKDSKIAELQKQLDDIKASTPGAGQVAREEGTAPKYMTFDEEIEMLANRRR